MSAASLNDPAFTGPALIHMAEAHAGLSEWGDDLSFTIGLDKLIAAINAVPYAAAFRSPLTQQCVQILSTRLRLEEDARQNPEILGGAARSGGS
jgi:hypothetical protein